MYRFRATTFAVYVRHADGASQADVTVARDRRQAIGQLRRKYGSEASFKLTDLRDVRPDDLHHYVDVPCFLHNRPLAPGAHLDN